MNRSRTFGALVGLVLAAAASPAQVRWTIDPKSSLAWWQMSPHLNHLWATTCPRDSSWRPGENRSSGWVINRKLKLPRSGYGNVDDTLNVPLFPRRNVRADCTEAVRGDVVAPDTVRWQGVHGTISVQGDALVTGESMRDNAMHQVMQTMLFPDIQFTLDSLVGLTRQADTLVGNAMGTLTVRTAQKPVTALVKAFPDGGGLRVLARWRFPAPLLLLELTPKLSYMGLGANTFLWHDIFMGADLVLHPGATTAAK